MQRSIFGLCPKGNVLLFEATLYSIHGSVIAKQGSERMSFIRWIKQARFITGSNGFKKRGLRFWSEPTLQFVCVLVVSKPRLGVTMLQLM